MHGDVRDTPLYREIEDLVRRTQEPAFGRITGAMDPAVVTAALRVLAGR